MTEVRLFSDPLYEDLTGININKPVLRVSHKSLERAYGSSQYRSMCPVCKEGVLLLHRNNTTFRLERADYCILCGQRVYYEGDLGLCDQEKPLEM